MSDEGFIPAFVMNEDVLNYWMKHYVNNNLCSLCGNSGVIHTEGLRSAAGVLVGRANYCICPNGQTKRQQETSILTK